MKSPPLRKGPGASGAPLSRAARKPAVPIELSITPDHLVCLEDGKKFRCLLRHLRGHGLTPDAYRAKWGLPATYPMVAPNYSKTSSELRKGLPRGEKLPGKAKRLRAAIVA